MSTPTLPPMPSTDTQDVNQELNAGLQNTPANTTPVPATPQGVPVSTDVPAALTSKPGEQFQGLGSAAKDLATGLVTPQPVSMAQQAYRGITEDIPAVYKTYEAARSSGVSITDAFKAANAKAQQINDAKNSLKNAVKEFTDNPNKAAWSVVLQLGTVALGGELLAPEAATSEMATAQAVAPEAAAEAEAAEVPKASSTPVETAVTKAAAESKLPAGKPASVAPTGEDIQPTLHRGYRDFVNKVATNNGLEPIPDSVHIRNVANELDNQFTARSQATFDKVEKITNVKPTTLKEIMKARADQIEQAAASGDVEKAGNLEQLQLRDENRMAKAFKDAEAQNVSVDQARDDWNKSLRAGELSSAVRNSVEGTTADPILNPTKLTPRLQKLSDPMGARPGKLQQLTSAPTDAYPVKIEYSPEGDVIDLDGRHRVMQAIERGDTRIGVQTKMRDGTIKNIKADPNEVAKKFGVTKESLAASDANQQYRAPGGQPRAAITTSDTGEDLASTLVEHAENARTAAQAIKEFVPSSPTGQQALQDLLRNNTTGKAGLRGKVTGRVDWNGAVKDFENLNPDEQAARFGNDVEKVRQYLGKQAQRQTAITLLKKSAVKGAGAVGLGALGTLGYEWAK